jgi:hypothetical protein
VVVPTLLFGKIYLRIYTLWKNCKLFSKLNYCLSKVGVIILLVSLQEGGQRGADRPANYSRELADYIIYVIDVSGGDKIPRKGGPGISQSDLLIVNKVSRPPPLSYHDQIANPSPFT